MASAQLRAEPRPLLLRRVREGVRPPERVAGSREHALEGAVRVWAVWKTVRAQVSVHDAREATWDGEAVRVRALCKGVQGAPGAGQAHPDRAHRPEAVPVRLLYALICPALHADQTHAGAYGSKTASVSVVWTEPVQPECTQASHVHAYGCQTVCV